MLGCGGRLEEAATANRRIEAVTKAPFRSRIMGGWVERSGRALRTTATPLGVYVLQRYSCGCTIREADIHL